MIGLGTKLRNVTFCAFDVETTGLSSLSRIVEIGAVRFRVSGTQKEFSTLVNPKQPIPRNVVQIHGIDDAAVIDAPSATEALSAFFKFVGNSVLIAHNASFDIRMIATEACITGLSLPPLMVMDNIGVASSFLPDQPNYQLMTLAEGVGFDTSHMHRAFTDALAVRAVVEAAITSVENWGNRTLEFLASEAGADYLPDYERTDSDMPIGYIQIAKALECEASIRIVYNGGTMGLAPRTITPFSFFSRDRVVYVSAFCHLDQRNKSFRLDRIMEIELE